MGKGKYLTLWRKKLPIILFTIERSKGQLYFEEFEQYDNRQKYSFRLNIVNRIVLTKSNSGDL